MAGSVADVGEPPVFFYGKYFVCVCVQVWVCACVTLISNLDALQPYFALVEQASLQHFEMLL